MSVYANWNDGSLAMPLTATGRIRTVRIEATPIPGRSHSVRATDSHSFGHGIHIAHTLLSRRRSRGREQRLSKFGLLRRSDVPAGPQRYGRP